ncbi:MAG: NADH-quinone oxidoreductase subunit J [Tepidisphaeraceae bacterium]
MLAAESITQLVPPILTIALCAMAGLGTWLMLPRQGKPPFTRNIGTGVAAVAGLSLAIILLSTVSLGSISTTIYFYIFSALAIFGALKVVTHPLPVYSAMYFVLTVFAGAGLFVLAWAEFLAAALVLIYAGAVLVTYTFVIMLASEASGQGLVSKLVGGTAENADYDGNARSPLLACTAGFTVLAVMIFAIFDKAQAIPRTVVPAADHAALARNDITSLATYLFTNQIVSVEIAGLILTLAMVGAIMIARRQVLLADDERIELDSPITSGPAAPGDDNPHSLPVEGKPGPRATRREAETLEL